MRRSHERRHAARRRQHGLGESIDIPPDFQLPDGPVREDQDLFAVMGTDDGDAASFVLFRIHPAGEATEEASTEEEVLPERGVEAAPIEDEAPTE